MCPAGATHGPTRGVRTQNAARTRRLSSVVAMEAVTLLGGPPLYIEAVSAQLRNQGVEVRLAEPATALALGEEGSDSADVVLVYCESDNDWAVLESLAGAPVVAVLPTFDKAGMIRALAAGTCPVHLRTSSEIIVESARAVASGEALLPMGLAQSLAAQAQAAEMPAELDPVETALVSALALDLGIAKMARDLGYSDRTIRRRLQSLYVKLGVATRGDAIRRCRAIENSPPNGTP